MFTFSQSPATASLNSPGLIHSRTLPYRSHRDGGWPDHFRLKYTQVLSQQIVFTQSPSLSNNPKILNNYLIFTVQWIICETELYDSVVRVNQDHLRNSVSIVQLWGGVYILRTHFWGSLFLHFVYREGLAEMWWKFDTRFYCPLNSTWITFITSYCSNPLHLRKKTKS